MGFTLRKKIPSFFLSPFFLAFPFALILVVLIPLDFPKYTAKLSETGLVDKQPGGMEYYSDLDGDGGSEQIIFFNNRQNEASVKILEEDGSIGEHYYFRGRMIGYYTDVFFGVYDSSGRERIFVFTLDHDSVLFHCVEPFGKPEMILRDQFISTIREMNGSHDFQIYYPLLEDLDGDGNKEFVASIMAGFPLKPRFSFLYDFTHDTLICAPDLGPVYHVQSVQDINGDGKKELFTNTYSIFNYPDSLAGGHDDRKAYILAFDNRLSPLFPPVEYPGKYIHVYTYPVMTAGGEYRLISLVTQMISGNCHPHLVLSDIDGNRLAEKQLPDPPNKITYSLCRDVTSSRRLFLLNDQGVTATVDADLDVHQVAKLENAGFGFFEQADVDQDGELEMIGYMGKFEYPAIFRDNFSFPVALEFPKSSGFWHYGVKKNKGGRPQVFIQHESVYYLFDYGINPWFYVKYPFYFGIYLSILGIILVAQYFQRVVLRQQSEAEKRIAGLQLQVLNNQIDPHFTFNAISAISAAILNQRPEEANRSLLSLSWLMRSCVGKTGTLSRSLGEELTFVEHWLNLIQSKIEGGFESRIDLSPEVDLSWQVPKMMIQIYAENAIKHGLRPRGEGGKLVIAVGSPHSAVGSSQSTVHDHFAISLPRYFAIFIEDNGIGRKQAHLNGTSGTGHGMEIMEQFYDTFNRFNRQKIRCEVIDLEDDDGNALGTRVEIVIPVGMKYTV